MLEQEVKLAFENVEAARQAVHTAGGRLVVSRRRLDDRLFDTADESLRRRGCALRIRREAGRGILTFKGPVRPGPVKSREEIEFTASDTDAVESLLDALGFRRWFRAAKYREEFQAGGTVVAVDETPMGVFVEIEGTPEDIGRTTAALSRSQTDYITASYPRLWAEWCHGHSRPFGDMIFEAAIEN